MFHKIFALLLLILSIPIFLLLIGILAYRKEKVFFTQKRIGYQEKVFVLYKFRTMNNLRDAKGELLSDAERVSKIGRILRKTSLDELPQLWNVLKGDMNFVGPRPLLLEYLPLYSTRQRLRHQVKPGITGFAQVKDRNNTTWQRRFALDVWYVKNRSFCLDCTIIWLTIKNIFLKADGEQLMPKFKGNS